MKYIAAVDFEHMDNGVFLNALSDALARQSVERAIVVHGDSEHTDRIMQMGVMREEAKIRSIKELNHRLIALFADSGVPAIGINGYQRNFISYHPTTEEFDFDRGYFESLPPQPLLLISNLVNNAETGEPLSLALPAFVKNLQAELQFDEVILFNSDDTDEIINHQNDNKQQVIRWDTMPDTFRQKHLPAEFQTFGRPVQLTTARVFGGLPETKKMATITV